MSEPVSLIELSKIVSLCTLLSKKKLVVFSHYMSIDLQIIYMYCRQSMSYNLVKLIFSLLYCVLKISVNRGANMSTAQWRESSVHSPRNLGVLHDTWCRPIIGLLSWPGGDGFCPVTTVCKSVSIWPLSVLVKWKVAKGQTLALLPLLTTQLGENCLFPLRTSFLERVILVLPSL